RRGALLLVNDRIDVALAVGADGVHLGGDSLPAGAVRRLVGRAALIGVSTHAPGEAPAGADFAFFGPVYETPSKARAQGEARPAVGVYRTIARHHGVTPGLLRHHPGPAP